MLVLLDETTAEWPDSLCASQSRTLRDHGRVDLFGRGERGRHQSSFSVIFFTSPPSIRVTDATGWPPSSIGTALTARNPLLALTALATASASDSLAFPMASPCSLASFRSSGSVIGSEFLIEPESWSTRTSAN